MTLRTGAIWQGAFVLLTLCIAAPSPGQTTVPATGRAVPVSAWVNQPDEWFKSAEGEKIVTNILSRQMTVGGWDKNYDSSTPGDWSGKGSVEQAEPGKKVVPHVATIDNDATYTELRILARAFRVTGRAEVRAAFDKGLAWLLESQYANGGFPQRFPLQNNYGRHITYNDDAMAGAMYLVKDIATGKPDFAFVPAAMRETCTKSFDRAIGCILDTQIVVDGKPTIWCQQHDEVTLKPAKARAYEFPTFCPAESSKLVELLMELPNPSEREKAAIEGAIAWLEAHKIVGKAYDRYPAPELQRGFDRTLRDAPGAPPIWARFYDLETAKPVFYDRDGSKHWTETELGVERRTGYAWYTLAPNDALKQYARWKAGQGK